MNIKIIKNESEYIESLKRFEEIFFAKSGTIESEEADLLALVIKKYEQENYKLEEPDPIEYIKYRMEKMGLEQKDGSSMIFVEN